METAPTPRDPRSHAAPAPQPARPASANGPERRRRRRRLARAWNGFYHTLRFVAGHVQGVYSAYAAFLTIAFVGTAALVAFVGIAKVVLEGFAQPLDEGTLRWLAEHRTAALSQAALQVTMLGTGIVLVVIVGVASAFLWLTRHRYSAYLLLGSYLGAWLVSTLLKDVFERPRPTVVHALAPVATSSFPSGHAMGSVAAYGAIALLVTRLEPSRRARVLTWTLAIALIVAIGASRMYLGVHYPSDVLGGFAAGLAWVAFAAAGMAALRFYGRVSPRILGQERNLDDAPSLPAEPPDAPGAALRPPTRSAR